ncbi:MAG: branched-chain amino acid ABC transporter substrate-binding protein [Microcystis wesenbergii Mw_QC_S_20081001_S30D]|jgi:branched-chain amino acid transport system substrate-binding protein|uniref:Branched-chain amino acid ABC transporter substrate-binding protein n=1 Tax=Microcystis wesenbergii Mw_QC_S_20081001_S30D TaxID=2486245 RepID=A0A552JV77_9CHRO|nr:ABC transporter substrate-binding protein [Microcystis aeruginosa W11-03]NCR93044.1 ABC transporter substrate-binding protein [Microcystis aeruginosa W11-06]TRU98606.1 MAG: branched-chain amino acid ABC transporter substrate-binding protein [Microcystis wesenbergii Mw_QC_B_20070930_S4D]TRU99424.1 MAG: branched-chain amino acid ABC transporter substrate-binding protein [Microcystis wesenbergii Mw_QC_S_20081001_S30D]TRU99792.1 MAG: branched-chain amino acid ABC transporter substrate-binding pr
MSRVVILEIGDGSFETGFSVTLEIRDNHLLIAPFAAGKLVPNLDIADALQNYRRAYYHWVKSQPSLGITVPHSMITHAAVGDPRDNLRKATKTLKDSLNEWLNSSSLSSIQNHILFHIGTESEVRFFIQTTHFDLQQIPWECWNFLHKWFPDVEIALTIQRNPPIINLTSPINILVILGNIDIKNEHTSLCLSSLQTVLGNQDKVSMQILSPGSYPPLSTINIHNELIKNPWDIVVYLGHSQTSSDGHDGVFIINNDTALSPENNLRNSLEIAVKKGLKLVICNSCDGLGIGRQLANIGVPHIIVMKEPIAVRVALRFLEVFLPNFLEHKSLQESLTIARQELRLHEFEVDAASSSLLPRLIENPEEPPLILPLPPENTAEDSQEYPDQSWHLRLSSRWKQALLFILSLLVTLSVLYGGGVFSDDASKYPEISLGEEILFKTNRQDKSLERGRQAFKNQEYKQAIQLFKQSLDRLPNNPEIRIYYNNARAAYQDRNPLKIATSVPLGNNPEIAQEILRGIALFQQELNDEQAKNPDFHFLQVVVANDNNSGVDAKDRAEKFVKDPSIIAVVGHNASAASEAAKDIYVPGKIVALSPTSFSPKISGNGYVYKMVPDLETFATTLSEYIREQTEKLIIQNPTNLICYDSRSGDNYNFAQKYRNILLGQQFQKFVKDEDFDCNIEPKINLGEQKIYQKIAQYQVNILMVAPYVNDLKRAVSIFKQRPAEKLNLVILGSPTFQSYLTLAEGKQGVENLVITVPWYDLKQDNYIQSFWQNKINVWRTPMSYDATKVILTALRKLYQQGQKFDRESLNQVLRNDFSIEGMTGTVRFDENGVRNMNNNPDDRRYLILQVKNGRFVPLAPIKSAGPL